MATEIRRHWFVVLWLVAAAALAGCGQKWEEREFPEAGFAATFPMPMVSQPRDRGVLTYWANAGNVHLLIVRSQLPEAMVKMVGAEEVLRMGYQQMRGGGSSREESPPSISRLQGRYPALDFHISGTAIDGKEGNKKGRLVLAGPHLFSITAIWRPEEKKGPEHADRFLISFKITR